LRGKGSETQRSPTGARLGGEKEAGSTTRAKKCPRGATHTFTNGQQHTHEISSSGLIYVKEEDAKRVRGKKERHSSPTTLRSDTCPVQESRGGALLTRGKPFQRKEQKNSYFTHKDILSQGREIYDHVGGVPVERRGRNDRGGKKAQQSWFCWGFFFFVGERYRRQ